MNIKELLKDQIMEYWSFNIYENDGHKCLDFIKFSGITSGIPGKIQDNIEWDTGERPEVIISTELWNESVEEVRLEHPELVEDCKKKQEKRNNNNNNNKVVSIENRIKMTARTIRFWKKELSENKDKSVVPMIKENLAESIRDLEWYGLKLKELS